MSSARAGAGKATISVSQVQMGRKRFIKEREKRMTSLSERKKRRKSVTARMLTAAVY